ncbi:MAG: hypothetical protein HRU19_00440 [Pseudobacteriovorax sp.]|nr:hypothetical protein [Pseudobacteriovorax sp.]
MSLSRITDENYMDKVYQFRDRQAGISVIYDPNHDRFLYNAYCLETKIMKELVTVEHDDVQAAIDLINEEFGTWELRDVHETKSGCGSCVAK